MVSQVTSLSDAKNHLNWDADRKVLSRYVIPAGASPTAVKS
jgi:hypothetical protein